jgi:hypothetical protein
MLDASSWQIGLEGISVETSDTENQDEVWRGMHR